MQAKTVEEKGAQAMPPTAVLRSKVITGRDVFFSHNLTVQSK
jgi:hypothetical protein